LDEFVGLGDGEGAEEELVEESENGGVGTDAYGKRQGGDDGEERVLAKGACGVAEILDKHRRLQGHVRGHCK
jgi:hypothetical protein